MESRPPCLPIVGHNHCLHNRACIGDYSALLVCARVVGNNSAPHPLCYVVGKLLTSVVALHPSELSAVGVYHHRHGDLGYLRPLGCHKHVHGEKEHNRLELLSLLVEDSVGRLSDLIGDSHQIVRSLVGHVYESALADKHPVIVGVNVGLERPVEQALG